MIPNIIHGHGSILTSSKKESSQTKEKKSGIKKNNSNQYFEFVKEQSVAAADLPKLRSSDSHQNHQNMLKSTINNRLQKYNHAFPSFIDIMNGTVGVHKSKKNTATASQYPPNNDVEEGNPQSPSQGRPQIDQVQRQGSGSEYAPTETQSTYENARSYAMSMASRENSEGG